MQLCSKTSDLQRAPEVEVMAEVEAEAEVEAKVEVENAPHKAQKNTEIDGGSQKIEACRDARSCVSPI
ncbi:hypothetical protein, partial [Anaerophaga thermohalophila]|uniref:hypothetical protein n=1 Tax=Anaerophaga thermohalophila TaxID=177400 RepID=UPI0005C58686